VSEEERIVGMMRAVTDQAAHDLRVGALEFPHDDAVLGQARAILAHGADALQVIWTLTEAELDELDAAEEVSADAAREYLNARIDRLG
jgi:hypothetical protein